ncbi:MAG: sulfite exporter TauE/SafE family protein [Verrucomicrobia bacterium]|nr:sulfite exporter TauE/SafE family protein [Verrucomicrobiota bacterium]
MQPWTAFLLGFAGSLHCAGMCGPLVLALAKARPRTRRESAGRLFYHAGRVLAYCALGLTFGLIGHAAALSGFQRWLSIALGGFLLACLLLPAKALFALPVVRGVNGLKAAMGRLFLRDSLASHASLGALNGLLPCGLVYVAAAGATATGHPFTGAGYMALFGLGTWPVMLTLHFGGQRFTPRWRLPLGSVTRLAVFLMAVLLIMRGLELGIPFLSPHPSLTSGENGRCH